MTTVLRFPESTRDDAPEEEHAPARWRLASYFHAGLAKGYRRLANPDSGLKLAKWRPDAVAGSTFEAWWQATAGGRNARRTSTCAYASGILAAWADHPEAEQCVNCDLPFVPGVEEGHSLCVDHGWTCNPACTAETCRVPSCREDEE